MNTKLFNSITCFIVSISNFNKFTVQAKQFPSVMSPFNIHDLKNTMTWKCERNVTVFNHIDKMREVMLSILHHKKWQKLQIAKNIFFHRLDEELDHYLCFQEMQDGNSQHENYHAQIRKSRSTTTWLDHTDNDEDVLLNNFMKQEILSDDSLTTESNFQQIIQDHSFIQTSTKSKSSLDCSVYQKAGYYKTYNPQVSRSVLKYFEQAVYKQSSTANQKKLDQLFLDSPERYVTLKTFDAFENLVALIYDCSIKKKYSTNMIINTMNNPNSFHLKKHQKFLK